MSAIGLGHFLQFLRCTAFRELYEETGITPDAVEVVHELKGWVHYDWPLKRQKEKRAMGVTNWRGQRQVWRAYIFHTTCS